MRGLAHSRASFAIAAYGVKVGVRINQPAADRFLPYLPLGWKPVSLANVDLTYSIDFQTEAVGVEAPHLLHRNGKKIAAFTDEQSLLDTFESHITIDIAAHSPHRVFVHAGVVGWQGRAIVIPGHSFSGKTTLVAALVTAGALYYSDEYAVFDRLGRVHPYPRDLHLRKQGESRQTKCKPEKLGAAVGRKPLPLGLVLSTRFREGARFRPRQISPGHGILDLFNNTVSARRAPEAALHAFHSALPGARFLRGSRGDAAEVAAHILSYLERSP